MTDVVWFYRHLRVVLQLKRHFPRKHYSACHTMLLSKVLGKMLVKDACLEKFNQCVIIDGYLIAKVVPDDNELVLNNDGIVLNNVGQVPNNHELVPNNDEQVPNDKNQCLIMNYNDSHGYNRNKAMIWLKWHKKSVSLCSSLGALIRLYIYLRSNLATSLRLTLGLIAYFGEKRKKKPRTLFQSNYLVSAKNCRLNGFH